MECCTCGVILGLLVRSLASICRVKQRFVLHWCPRLIPQQQLHQHHPVNDCRNRDWLGFALQIISIGAWVVAQVLALQFCGRCCMLFQQYDSELGSLSTLLRYCATQFCVVKPCMVVKWWTIVCFDAGAAVYRQLQEREC